MLNYDPEVIQTFAKRLYEQADRLAFMTALMWGFGGFLIGGTITYTMGGAAVFVAIILAGGAAYFGYQRGIEKGFILRLEAQTALCQVEIEKNTRLHQA